MSDTEIKLTLAGARDHGIIRGWYRDSQNYVIVPEFGETVTFDQAEIQPFCEMIHAAIHAAAQADT